MAGPRSRYQYISDDGETYQTKMDTSNAIAVGAVAAAGTEPFLPNNYQPRYVLAQHLGNQRRITCPDPAAAIWTDTGGNITLVDTAVHPSVDRVTSLMGRIGEKRFAR